MKLSDINLLPGSAGNPTGKRTTAWGLITMLWTNKIPIPHEPDVTGFERVKCALGLDRFSIYHNNTTAYIAQYQHGKRYWYKTNTD